MNRRFLKMLISVFVFIGIVGLKMFSVYNEGKENELVVSESTLPVVSVMFEGLDINNLCGYTADMEIKYMRENITPVTADNKLNIIIDRYDNTIVNISYQIRTLDGERLIEEYEADYFEVEDNQVNLEFELSNMLEYDTEYMFNVILVTESHEKINYYTRIIKESQPTIKDYVEYVKAFSASTFDKDSFSDYKASLERYGSNDDTNFGVVNNGSDTESITWGDLNPEYVSAPQVQIREIIGDISCIELKYVVQAKDEYDHKQYYNVSEYFRVRQGSSMMYVYVYERRMEQLFECNDYSVTNTRVNLGIDSDLTVEMSESPKGTYLSFVKERNLWNLNLSNNTMVNIFSMDSGMSEDVRNKFDNSEIEIVSTSQEGDVLFLVYGYMNRGIHEGKVGVALYNYTAKTNAVEELVFVPSRKSYYVLKENVGKFAYITSDNLLYLMLEDSIYTITFDSNEYVQLVSGLREGNFIISDDNTMVAWHENGSLYEADSIRVIDIENNEDYVIKAAEGEWIKVFGFVEHDLVYGTARKEDVATYSNDKTAFPMYKLTVNVNDKEAEEYAKDGYYISGISINGNVINIERMTVDEQGVLVTATADQFINKVTEKINLSEQATIATELKKLEVVINKAFSPDEVRKVSYKKANEISYTSANTLTVENSTDYEDKNYYLYANGGLYLSTEDISMAVRLAQEKYGVVVDGNGQQIFARMSKSNNTSITGVDKLCEKGYGNMAAVLADTEISTLEIVGAGSETIFYFTSKNKAVITFIEDVGMVAISGHSGYATLIQEVEMTNLWTREVTTMDYEDALEILDNNKRYIVVEN